MELLQNLGYFLIGSGILAFVAKTLFEKYMKNSLEDHKHRLELISQEQQIRYSKLHNDRADVIRALYQKLVEMERSMRFYVFPAHFQGNPSREEKRAKAGMAADDFFNYFYPNEIFFDDSIRDLVNEMNGLYQDVWIHTTTYDKEVAESLAETHHEFNDDAVHTVMKAWETIDTKIPPLKARLKSQLQELLGVTKS